MVIGTPAGEDLSWTACGYDPTLGAYPASQFFENALSEARRVIAQKVNKHLQTLHGLRILRQPGGDWTAVKIVDQLLALTREWGNGRLIYGPMLSYAYINGHEFYQYHPPEDPLSEGFPMPRSEHADQYDHYEHIGVALNALQKLLEEFGCWEEEVVDVREATAMASMIAQTNCCKDANLALVRQTFHRAGLSANFRVIQGCSVHFMEPDLLERRPYVTMSEGRACSCAFWLLVLVLHGRHAHQCFHSCLCEKCALFPSC